MRLIGVRSKETGTASPVCRSPDERVSANSGVTTQRGTTHPGFRFRSSGLRHGRHCVRRRHLWRETSSM